jgi:DNA-binding transcriptional MerR regulator
MASNRTGEKSAAAFRTISEVSDELQVPQHVLRFWETKFSQVRPMKRGGGRRYYRPEDIELLRSIRDHLYTDGYTIKGVQKLLREGQIKAATPDGSEAPTPSESGQGSNGGGEAGEQARQAGNRPAPDDREGLSAAQRRTVEEVLAELTDLRDALRKREPPRG